MLQEAELWAQLSISKFKSIKNMGFSTFSSLYNAGVIPVTDYCAAVWGHKLYQKRKLFKNVLYDSIRGA